MVFITCIALKKLLDKKQPASSARTMSCYFNSLELRSTTMHTAQCIGVIHEVGWRV